MLEGGPSLCILHRNQVEAYQQFIIIFGTDSTTKSHKRGHWELESAARIVKFQSSLPISVAIFFNEVEHHHEYQKNQNSPIYKTCESHNQNQPEVAAKYAAEIAGFHA